jgi:hypothetical protein
MAQDSLHPDLYPFATQDGKAIPLDIIRPAGLIIQEFTSNSNTALNSTEELDVAVFMASKPCTVSFDTEIPYPAVNGTFYPGALIVPAGVIVTVKCPSSSLFVRGLSEGGTLYIQAIERWAGLALSVQLQRK